MAQVEIQVNGRSYAVACDDGQEAEVERLGRFLDAKVMALVEGVGQVGETRLLLLAGLTIADELIDAEQRPALVPEPLPAPVAPVVSEPIVDEALIVEFLDRVAGRIEQVALALEQA